jgi:tetratricopeptide (TPR) repeat protein
MADRYAYLPLSGLFLAGVWGVVEVLERFRVPLSLRWAITAVWLGILCLLTVRQLGYWENDIELWSHALQVTPQNETAESQLAAAFVFRGDRDSALPHLLNVVRMDPTNIAPYVSIGAAYMMQGRKQEAIDQFETVVKLSDHDGLSPRDRDLRSTALLNLGFSDVAGSDYARALGHFRQANIADPQTVAQAIRADERALASEDSESDYLELALLLQAEGQEEAAVSVLRRAITTYPQYQDSSRLLSYLKPGQR